MIAQIPTVDDLVTQAAAGDSRACRLLYDRYSRAMYNTALRITGNRADAEDVLQDAFTAAFTQLHSYTQRASFGAWLRRIVIYRAIAILRQKKIAFSELNETVPDPAEEHAIDEKEILFTVERIKKAMETLPGGYRAVLSLHLLEGYDYEEIAEIMGVTTSTIRTQYMRGKQKLLITIKQLPES